MIRVQTPFFFVHLQCHSSSLELLIVDHLSMSFDAFDCPYRYLNVQGADPDGVACRD